MRVVRVAESMLSFSEEDDEYGLETMGYEMHPWSLTAEHPPVEVIDELAEAMGRECYHSWERPNPETATNEGYLKNILAKKHFSVLEHGTVTYYVEGVTRNLLLELERHRHLSYSVVSTRYVDMSDSKLVEPKAFRLLRGRERTILWSAWQRNHVDAIDIYRTTYDKLIAKGAKKKEAREAARDILPGGIETDLGVTGNIRAWREVIEKRNAPGAAADIQELAQLILADLKKLCPNSVQDM